MSITRRVIFLSLLAVVGLRLGAAIAVPTGGSPRPSNHNLVMNSDFTAHSADGPAAYELAGDLHYRALTDRTAGTAGWGVAFDSANDVNHDGSISGSVAAARGGN